MMAHRKRDEETKGGRLWESLKRTAGESLVTVSAGGEVTLCDCEKIVTYGECEIVVRLKGLTVGVCGSSLTLDTYRRDHAVIRGRVDSVTFRRRESRGRER